MERRYREIETGNNNLMDEITKLTSEFNHSKEREEIWKEEVSKHKCKMRSLEEENDALHSQVMAEQNSHQLTQVSLIAVQTNFDALQAEFERVTKQLQVVFHTAPYSL